MILVNPHLVSGDFASVGGVFLFFIRFRIADLGNFVAFLIFGTSKPF
jgi:hypothetical protein